MILSSHHKLQMLACALITPFFFSAAALGQANPRDLVSKMVQNELHGESHPQYWMYLDKTKDHGHTTVKRVIETPQCWLSWIISIDGKPPSADQRKKNKDDLNSLVNSEDARQKNRKNIDEDSQKADELLKILPDAFLFTNEGQKGRSIGLKFRPNPKYAPQSDEAKVFHAMAGELQIDSKESRLARLSGHLTSDVDFGLGILGKVYKGGTFRVVQSEVAPQDWELSLLDVHIKGRALFFHTISEQQHEVKTNFKPVPDGLSLQQLADMLQSGAPIQQKSAK